MFSTLFLILTKDKKGDRSKDKDYYKEREGGIKKYFKGSIYDKADSFIKETGYMMSTEKYIVVHILLIALILISLLQGIILKSSKAYGAAARIILLTLILNYIIFLFTKKYREKLLIELSKIQGIMYFQSKIGVPEDIVLVNASYVAKEPLKRPLEKLASAYRFKKDIEKELNEFRKISKLTELQTFSFILEQKRYSGKSEESHRAQSNMLKRNRRLRKKFERHGKRTKLVFASVLLFGCYIMLTAGPMIRNVIRSWNLMFR